MLTPTYMKTLSQDLINYYKNLEEDVLIDIARRLGSATAERQTEAIINLGYELKDIQKKVNKYSEDGGVAFQKLIDKSSLKNYDNDMQAYLKGGKKLKKYTDNKAVLKFVEAIKKDSKGEFRNITKTVGVAGKSLDEFYKTKLSQGIINLSSGAFDRKTVIKKIVDEVGKTGLQSIGYANRNMNIKSAVRMCVNSTINRLSSQVGLMNAQDMEQDLMELTSHIGARPTHSVWQGKIVSLSGRAGYLRLDDIGFGQADGFMGVNCRHNWYPFFEGLSIPMQDNGDYEIIQKNNLIQRNIEVCERKETMYNELNEKELAKAEKIKATKLKQKIEKVPEVPQSLKNFDNHRKEWYANRASGFVPAEIEQEAMKNLKEIINNSELSMRFKSNYLDSLLKTGKFKNQFETKTSGGTVSKTYRKEATSKLFGADVDTLKSKDFEKYGYLGNKDFIEDFAKNSQSGGTSQYGDVIIRFDREKLKNRVTYTIDNSLGNAVQGNIIAESIETPTINAIHLDDIEGYCDKLIKNKVNTVEELTSVLDVRYLELQFHGNITLDDVTEICFTRDIPDKNIIQNLKNKNIKMFEIREGGFDENYDFNKGKLIEL